MKKIYLWAVIIIAVIILLGFFYRKQPIQTIPNLPQALIDCKAYPNGATENVNETSRLTIYLPKNLYPNQSMLHFVTASGTATAGWISNAGPVGESYGASTTCYAYYYEFDGNGEVDLLATSSVTGVPDYRVRFIVSPVLGSTTIDYSNTKYGFTFTLPKDWEGYSVVNGTWNGTYVDQNSKATSGPELLVRNPKWTAKTPYQDIPIMIFTPAQWKEVVGENLSVSAAPIAPSMLGKNANYVFALPARYNYAFPAGWEEVEAILKTNPLKAH